TGENTHTETHARTVKKSGVFGSGGVGFTLGKQQVDTTADLEEVTHSGSLIGSLDGRVDIVAGGDVTVTGSEVITQDGIGMSGQNATRQASNDSTDFPDAQRSRQRGLNVSRTGGAVSTAMAVADSVQRAGEVQDDRLAALHVARAG